MNRPYSILTILGAVVVLLFFVFVFEGKSHTQGAILKENENVFLVVALDPEVTVKESGKPAFEKVEGKAKVSSGTEIKTSPTGQAALLYPNGTIAQIEANTHISIKTLANNGNNSIIKVFSGILRSKVKKLLGPDDYYEIETPALTTSVRGTIFKVEVLGTSSSVLAVQGKVRVASQDGEIALLPGEETSLQDGTVEKRKANLETFRQEVFESEAIEDDLKRPEIQEIIDRYPNFSPSAGLTPDNPFYFAEQVAEFLGGAFVFGNQKAERALSLAEERLSEIQALAAKGKSAEGVTREYESKIEEAARRAEQTGLTTAVQQVAQATTRHLTVLDEVLETIPEEAKVGIRMAIDVSKQGQISALNALNEKSPRAAFETARLAAQFSVEKIMANSSQANILDTQTALNDYETVRAVIDDASQNQTVLALHHSGGLGADVASLGLAQELGRNLPLSVADKISEVRNNNAEEQINAMRLSVQEYPIETNEIFLDSLNYQAERIEEAAEEQQDVGNEVENYQKYSDFGETIKKIAGGLRTGDTTVEELVQKATSHHLRVLEDVKQKVPAQALEGINRAIENAKRVQEIRPQVPPAVIPAPAERRVTPRLAPTPTLPTKPQPTAPVPTSTTPTTTAPSPTTTPMPAAPQPTAPVPTVSPMPAPYQPAPIPR